MYTHGYGDFHGGQSGGFQGDQQKRGFIARNRTDCPLVIFSEKWIRLLGSLSLNLGFKMAAIHYNLARKTSMYIYYNI